MLNLRDFKLNLQIALAALLVVVTSGWVGDGLKGECLFGAWFGMDEPACGAAYRWGMIFVALVAFALSAWFMSRAGRKMLGVRHLKPSESVAPHKVLIMAVTALNPLPQEEEGHITVTRAPHSATLCGQIEADVAQFDGWQPAPNLQQMLRALRPHLGTLERVFLVGSQGERGSFSMLAQARSVVRLYDSALEITCHSEPGGVDFENIADMTALFDQLVRKAEQEGYAESDIILDITGGQKTASIAAALATLKRQHLEFQYVQTGHNPKVLSFNMVAELPGEVRG